MRIENLEIIWGINRQKLKKNADACRIWPLLVIIPNIRKISLRLKQKGFCVSINILSPLYNSASLSKGKVLNNIIIV
jgi:hypothetical protein